jgi:hypothetical protein
MATPFVPGSGKPDEKSAKALEYIAGRLGSIDDTLLKLLKALEAKGK